jgi:hypothetical protein
MTRRRAPMKIKKIDEKQVEKKENGLKVKTRLKAGPADDIAVCG